VCNVAVDAWTVSAKLADPWKIISNIWLVLSDRNVAATGHRNMKTYEWTCWQCCSYHHRSPLVSLIQLMPSCISAIDWKSTQRTLVCIYRNILMYSPVWRRCIDYLHYKSGDMPIAFPYEHHKQPKLPSTWRDGIC